MQNQQRQQTKNHLLLWTLLALTLLLPQLTRASTISDLTPTSHWTCDESSLIRYDSNTTLSNDLSDNNTVGSQTGLLSNACDLESSNAEFLAITNADQTDLGFPADTLTISYWVNFESFPSDARTISKWDSTGNQYGYRTYHTSNSLWFDWFDDSNTNGWCGGSYSFSTGTWYHVVFAIDAPNNGCYIYVNNTPVSLTSTAYHGSIKQNSAPFNIGAQSSNNYYFDGLIDEVTVFAYKLSSTEVTTLYNSGTPLSYSSGGSGTTTSTTTATTTTGISDDSNIVFMLGVIIFFLAFLWIGFIFNSIRKK